MSSVVVSRFCARSGMSAVTVTVFAPSSACSVTGAPSCAEKANDTDNPGKFIDIARRRLEKGQCYHQPSFGCREFPAHFRPWAGGPVPAISETRSLGLMLYDMDYSDQRNIQPTFFLAELVNGVLEVAGKEVLR